LVFSQRGRELPTKVTESEALDGTCTAEISDIGFGGPVVLDGPGGGFNLIDRPGGSPDMSTGGGGDGDGCGCRLGGRATASAPVALLALLGLAGLLLRRRRC